ncbi:FAD-dependent monooxygenase [Salinibacterium sp. PAMC 21357]|uniref:FAD-dependent monooxygenase n=1 Tax=Salinibacterium sp. PAMC 21357 TaxID=1112215 RepID=UPI0002893AF2|nr:FAD-dependent monooxygenase [Salinibacterium sp. PAMC 21357]
MQFHQDGYVSGDPRIHVASTIGDERPHEIPDNVDVLIVGTGPAGMIAAAQLSQFPNVTTRIVEQRAGRLEIGQADGIQPRSVETFHAFGFAQQIIQEAYQRSETCFWKPDPADPTRITRAAVTPDDDKSISEFPRLTVNQARVLDYFAEVAANSPTRVAPDCGTEFIDLEIASEGVYPVAVTLRTVAGEERVIHAKYVLGADGARSKVRAAIGCVSSGERANHAWGVIDALAVTDFPDIRSKCTIQSDAGNILLIPREGGYLFRMYVDLGAVANDNDGAVRRTTANQIVAKANEILHPYVLDVKEVAWHSVYEVGHRVTDRFDDVPLAEVGTRAPRVFIAGDACHTHSAKAGQGMNVSMQDGWNNAWKLGHVLEGRSPQSLLATYSVERHQVAHDLIDFDRTWSTMLAKKPEEFESTSELEDFYVRTGEFPAGFLTQYTESLLTDNADHQELASGFALGKRFKSAMVTRVCDGNPLHLGHQATADGRWRIYVFADAAPAVALDGAPSVGSFAVDNFARWLADSADSPLSAPPDGPGTGARFHVNVIYPASHRAVDVSAVPAVFRPLVGPFSLINYENIYALNAAENIFEQRGISRAGVVVVVRPDQYVSLIAPLADAADQLTAFFRPLLAT